MLTRADKEQQVAEGAEMMASGHVTIVADYRGTTVGKVTALRHELFKSKSAARVFKNSLGKLSAKKAYAEIDNKQLEQFLNLFEGMTMIITGKEDPVSPAKVLAEFVKKNENFKLRGALFEGAFLDERGVKDLATMPSKPEAQSMLLSAMNAPATKLLRTLNASAESLVRVLEARRKQLEEQQGGGAAA
jgi:large subunit ribosomal protein L10